MEYPYKISVIIPIFGVEKFIERCARSLFEQTLEEIEYIFVDDCTKDNSMTILNAVLEKYPQKKDHVIILKHEHNKGLPQARKTGVAVARGEYIAHCDSDDWVEEGMYERMYATAKREDADIVCCGYYKSDGNAKTPVNVYPTKTLLTGPVWNKLVHNELYRHEEIEYPVANKAEDGALMVQLSYFAKNVAYINDSLYYYFQNPESMCRVMTEEALLKRVEQEHKNVELMINFLRRVNALEKYKSDIVRWKKTCRDNLLPYYNEKKFRRLWRNTYPEVNRQYLLDSSNSCHARINFLMDYLGLRNIWIGIKKIWYK